MTASYDLASSVGLCVGLDDEGGAEGCNVAGSFVGLFVGRRDGENVGRVDGEGVGFEVGCKIYKYH